MIVHEVVVGKKRTALSLTRDHKTVYVGSAESDVRYRDMLVNGRHRWELYAEPTIDFICLDRTGAAWPQSRPVIEQTIRKADGVMIMVSAQTLADPWVCWEIQCAVANSIPTVGVDLRKSPGQSVPEALEGKMIQFGWEWFAAFFNRL